MSQMMPQYKWPAIWRIDFVQRTIRNYFLSLYELSVLHFALWGLPVYVSVQAFLVLYHDLQIYSQPIRPCNIMMHGRLKWRNTQGVNLVRWTPLNDENPERSLVRSWFWHHLEILKSTEEHWSVSKLTSCRESDCIESMIKHIGNIYCDNRIINCEIWQTITLFGNFTRYTIMDT